MAVFTKPTSRSYSRLTVEAMALLGKMIRLARIEQKITSIELAERAGISRGLLQRIEKGDLKCEIGAVFEVATLLGVSLFDETPSNLSAHMKRVDERLTLLPKYARAPQPEVKDDF